MGKRSPKVDEYVAKAAPFAQPILAHLREVVHAACPEVDEQIKWRMPSFEWKGMLCGMAAFKAHAVFGFWKHDLIVGDDPKAKQAMGSFGCLKSVADPPSAAALKKYVRTAMKLNDAGVKAPMRKTRPKTPVKLHPEFAAALKKSARARHIATAIEWLAQGKRLNWKYEAC